MLVVFLYNSAIQEVFEEIDGGRPMGVGWLGKPSEDTASEVKIEGYAGPDVQSTKEQHCRPRK